jgi:hypothetical protein
MQVSRSMPVSDLISSCPRQFSYCRSGELRVVRQRISKVPRKPRVQYFVMEVEPETALKKGRQFATPRPDRIVGGGLTVKF